MPLISNTADNLGLLFSQTRAGKFRFEIELYGQGLGDIGLSRTVLNAPCGSTSNVAVPSNSGSGGYTKLSMAVPLSRSIQIQPRFYRGGNNTQTETSTDNNTGTTNTIVTTTKVGGDGAAFSIDNEWMAIAGGSGVVKYDVTFFQSTSGSCPGGFGISGLSNNITITATPTTNGKGGINTSNPTASPSFGTDISNSSSSTISGTSPNSVFNFSGTFNGAGGAGAPGGPSVATTTATAGEGNIRIYADTSGISTSGLISSVPGTSMELLSSADGFWVGSSKVVVRSPITGLSTTFTSDTEMTIRELKALLEPTVDLAFDVELFGEGIGTNPNLFDSTFSGPPVTGDTNVFVPNDSGRGGYTKLRVVTPLSYNISPQPTLYAGGNAVNTGTGSSSKSGGNASAFAINNQWMAVAGGSGQISYSQTANYRIETQPDFSIERFGSQDTTITTQPVIQGRGGINTTNPTAVPQKGGDSSVSFSGGITGSPPSQNASFSGTFGGGGGGGAGGGAGRVGVTSAQGGAGNIRIWAETAAAGVATSKGDLTSVSGVYMRLLDSASGISTGASRVVIRSPITGISTAYSANSTISLTTLKNILYPPEVFSPSSVFATGGTVTEIGGYRIHTFTSSGTLSVSSIAGSTPIEYLVVAGGGGGGGGDAAELPGGGAGGVREGSFLPNITDYAITVGAGGAGGTTTLGSRGGNGGNSSISTIVTSTGGGGGGSVDSNKGGSSGAAGLSGGSGGGGGADSNGNRNGGTGITGQGFSGSASSGSARGAGGGAGGAASGGVGGPAIAKYITGAATYAKGGDASSTTGLQPNNTGNGGVKLSPGADGIVIIRYKYP